MEGSVSVLKRRLAASAALSPPILHGSGMGGTAFLMRRPALPGCGRFRKPFMSEAAHVHVLLVEDNSTDYVLTRQRLSSADPYIHTLTWARSYEEGLNRLLTERFDVCLLDFQLAERTGLELLRSVRERGVDIPFILLTGREEDELDIVALRAGAADHLQKDQVTPWLLSRSIRHAMERHRTEEVLRRSEERFRSLIEKSHDGSALVSAEGVIEYVSPSIQSILGYTEAEFLGASAFEFTHPDDLVQRNPHSPSLADLPLESRTRPLRLRHRDGSWRWMEVTSTNLLNDPNVGAIVINYRDITERRQAEEALTVQTETLSAVMDHIPLFIVLFDAEDRITWVNRAFERSLGWEMGMTVQDDFLKRVYPDPEARRTVQEFIQAASDEWLETTMHTRSGTILDVVWTNARLPDGRKMGVGQDVTRRKRLEADLSQAQKMEAVGRLAGGVAHDFNNMLAVINGYAELLLRRAPASDPTTKQLEQILAAGQRAGALTRQLLAFSRKQVLAPKVLDLNAVLDDITGLIRRLIGEDVELVTRPGRELAPIRADPGQIEQVIMNLCVNARDAMPRGGHLTLSTATLTLTQDDTLDTPTLPAGHYTSLTVADTGVGMSPEVKRHIFEPFYTTKERGKGTGLGLATVCGIIEQTGGYIRVRSAPNEGTAFRIFLTAAPDALVQSPEDQERGKEPVRGGAETILVVEDQTLVRRMVREVLSELGYTVLEAQRPDEALHICERYVEPIHMVLTDIVLPQMNGVTLARRLLEQRPDLRVVFMSGHTDAETLSEAAEISGAFLQKPFSAAALAQLTRRELDEIVPSGDTDTSRACHVLLVEDDADARSILAEILEAEGFVTAQAGDGAEALQYLRQQPPVQLILLDLMLPGTNGWVFRLEQRADPNWAKVPVIVLSGAYDVEATAEFLEAVDYFAKPLDVPRLLESVRKHCGVAS